MNQSEDDMASTTRKSSKREETEPDVFTGREEAEDNQQVADAGVPGQIQYPDRWVDAERAGKFAAGKVDTLDEDEDRDTSGWQNPADRSDEVQDPDDDDDKSDRKRSSKSDDKHDIGPNDKDKR